MAQIDKTEEIGKRKSKLPPIDCLLIWSGKISMTSFILLGVALLVKDNLCPNYLLALFGIPLMLLATFLFILWVKKEILPDEMRMEHNKYEAKIEELDTKINDLLAANNDLLVANENLKKEVAKLPTAQGE